MMSRIRLVHETEETVMERPGAVLEPAQEGRGLGARLLSWLPQVVAARGSTKHMKMIEMLPMGGRRHLMLVSCDGERFLVGAGADGVASIVRVHAAAAVAEAGSVQPWT